MFLHTAARVNVIFLTFKSLFHLYSAATFSAQSTDFWKRKHDRYMEDTTETFTWNWSSFLQSLLPHFKLKYQFVLRCKYVCAVIAMWLNSSQKRHLCVGINKLGRGEILNDFNGHRQWTQDYIIKKLSFWTLTHKQQYLHTLNGLFLWNTLPHTIYYLWNWSLVSNIM